jgi:hypothetical protein
MLNPVRNQAIFIPNPIFFAVNEYDNALDNSMTGG